MIQMQILNPQRTTVSIGQLAPNFLIRKQESIQLFFQLNILIV